MLKTIKQTVWKWFYRHVPAKKWPRVLQIRYGMKLYANKMGYSFDIHHPQTFTEKIQWYKIVYNDPTMSRIVDKYDFKGYIQEKLGPGYTIPVLGCWNSVEELKRDWASLPDVFFLKSTVSGNGLNMTAVKEKPAQLSPELEKEIRAWFDPYNTLVNQRLRPYQNCVPRVLAEQYMTQINGQLYDYKFFCFNGVPHYVYVAVDHFQGQVSHISFYDLDWKRLDVQYGDHPNCDAEKPRFFDEMLEISKKLSAGFPFVRVDFFETQERLYVAEMTFFPGGGLTPYHPESFNEELGRLFKMP